MTEDVNIQEKREIQRHQLSAYLEVYNRNTNKPIGYIGNISARGLMVISRWPMMCGAVYPLQLRLPEEPASEHGMGDIINFMAKCHWTKRDIDPEFSDSGFSFCNGGEPLAQLASSLSRFFSFRGNASSSEQDDGHQG
jgi:hypothetical protein